MAVISKISAQKRAGRYNIFLDQHYAFSASEKTVAEFMLLKGKELSSAEITKIKRFDADAKASDLAAHYLSYEPRTVYEILQYLNKHHISAEAANQAVQELTELGYLDDRQYVKLFLQNNLRVGSDGPRSLNRKLLAKGIAAEISGQELEDVPQEDWLTVGKRVIKSMQHQAGRISIRELKRKMLHKLLSHGFDSGTAKLIIDELDITPNADEEREALKKQGIKAYRRFRHLDPRKRRFKIRNYLYQHGFSASEIDAFLDGEIIALDELNEY